MRRPRTLTWRIAGAVGALSVVAAGGLAHAAPRAQQIWQWVSEPQAGFRPWDQALQHAITGVDVNAYLLTDRPYAAALIQVAHRGIPVQVILAANPYDDTAAVTTERHLFAGTRVHVRWAPARFDRPYATDHAKYLLVNPGHRNALAIIGSPNGTASAFGGWNAEDALETTNRATTTALAATFHADWTDHLAGPAPRRALMLSPGAQPALRALLTAPGPVAVTTEEVGDVPTLWSALAAHHHNARLLLPTSAVDSAAAQSRLKQLERAGVHVRTLQTPYLHAKALITATTTWVGSQNWSAPSMTSNREVGLVVANARIHRQALHWFDRLWQSARPWH